MRPFISDIHNLTQAAIILQVQPRKVITNKIKIIERNYKYKYKTKLENLLLKRLKIYCKFETA